MNEFQIFVDYTWPFFIGVVFIRFFCGFLAISLDFFEISLGKK